MTALEQESQRRLHLLKQTSPREFPTGAQPLVMTSLNLKRQKPDQARTSHRPMGFNAQAWGALLRHFETFSGDMVPDYRQIVPILNMTMGEATETVIDINGVQCKRREWVFPESLLPVLVQYAIENGYPKAAKRMVYGLCPAFGINVKRGNAPSISGSATMIFSKPQKNTDGSENFVMSGAVAQNHKTRITGANVTAPVVLSITSPGVAAKSVSLAIGNTAAQNIAAFLAQGFTVLSTGAIATGTGKTQVINYTGNGPFSVGGAALDLTAPPTVAAYVTAIKTANPTRTTLAGTGAITKGNPEGVTVSGASNSVFNGFYARATDFNGRPSYLRSGNTVLYYTGSGWGMGQGNLGQGIANAYANNSTGTTVPLTGWTGPDSSTPTVALNAASDGVVTLTLTDNASAGNAADFPVVGTGATSVSTAPGGSDGQIDVEFTNPGNILVSVNKTSGDGYALSTPQFGSDGKLRVPTQWPLLPQHFTLKAAAKLADLDASPPLKGVHETDLQLSNIVEPDQVFEEGDLGYQNHVGGDIEVKHKIVFVSDELNADSQIQKYRDDADAAPARALWHQNKATHPDKLHSLLYEGKFAAGEAYAPSAGGKVFQYEFEQTLELNDELTTPDGQPGILRFVQTEPV